MGSYYTKKELIQFGFKSVGDNVKVTKKVSLYKILGTLGSNLRIDDHVVLIGNISIGSYTHIAPNCLLNSGPSTITIEDFVSISSNCSIFGSSDNYSGDSLCNPCCPSEFVEGINDEVLISRGSALGANAVVLPGSFIPKYTTIGALSLVQKGMNLSVGTAYVSRAMMLTPMHKRNIAVLEAKVEKILTLKHANT